MNKILGILMPYLIVGFVGGMSFASISYQTLLMALVIGMMIGIWMFALTKCEGTSLMKGLLLVNNVLLIAVAVASVLIPDIDILSQLGLITTLLFPINMVGYYMVNHNKPRLSMSYRYSFRNRRKRYF
ncbi:MAG: hypothetical protein RR585_11430 [Coprobacillus sp.]